jgi:hypothetical protein
MLRGASLTALGQGQEGLSLVTRGIAGIRATGAVAGTATALMVLAWAYARYSPKLTRSSNSSVVCCGA